MTAPSKWTKAELHNRLAETRSELELTEKARQILAKDVERLRKKVHIRENCLEAERRVENDLREERDRYRRIYGEIRDSRIWRISIESQYVQFGSKDRAQEVVRLLLDAGLWYLRLKEMK